MKYKDSRFYAIKVILFIALLLLSYTFFDPDMMYPVRSRGERVMDVVPRGTELELKVKTGSWAGRTHSQQFPRQVYWSLLCINSG